MSRVLNAKVTLLQQQLADAVKERDEADAKRLAKLYNGLSWDDCIKLRDLLNKHIQDTYDGDNE